MFLEHWLWCLMNFLNILSSLNLIQIISHVSIIYYKHYHECFWITCNVNIVFDNKTWKQNHGYYQLRFLLVSLHPSWMLHDIPSQHKQTHAKETQISIIEQTTHIKTFITYYALELSPCTFKCASSNCNYEF
jgi:hypothetical protein